MPKWSFDEETDEFKCDALYFAGCAHTETVKIGRAIDPKKRVIELRSGNPHRLEVIGQVPNGGWQEVFWHVCWDNWRLNGEWFSATKPLQKAIAAAVSGKDWTDHVPRLFRRDCDIGEWQEHMLDALDAYEEEVLRKDPCITPTTAAWSFIFDSDFDGRSVLTRHVEAMQSLEAKNPELFASPSPTTGDEL